MTKANKVKTSDGRVVIVEVMTPEELGKEWARNFRERYPTQSFTVECVDGIGVALLHGADLTGKAWKEARRAFIKGARKAWGGAK